MEIEIKYEDIKDIEELMNQIEEILNKTFEPLNMEVLGIQLKQK